LLTIFLFDKGAVVRQSISFNGALEEEDPYDLLAESRFVIAQLSSQLHARRMKRLCAAMAAYALVAVAFALSGGFVTPSRTYLSMTPVDLIPALVLLCAYTAFEAVRYALTLSAEVQEINLLREYQLRVTEAAEEALHKEALHEDEKSK
jgi:hypothetical protein